MSERRSDEPEEKSIKTAASGIECPVCGAMNDPDATECRVCGAIFSDTDYERENMTDEGTEEPASEENEEAINLNEEDYIECPVCGAENPPGSTECRVCGADLSVAESSEMESEEAINDEATAESISDVETAHGEEENSEEEIEEPPSVENEQESSLNEEDYIVCPICGAENPPGSTECLVCGADLPQYEPAPEEGPGEAESGEEMQDESITEESPVEEEIIDESVVIEDEGHETAPEEESEGEEFVIEEAEASESSVETETVEATEEEQETKICDFCGAEVPADAEVCPFCGERLNGGEIECPVCGAYSPAGSTVCVVCGAELNGAEELTEADEGPKETAEEIEEPEEVSAEEVSEQEKGAEEAKSGLTCPVCGSPLEEGDVICKNCWTDLTVMIKCPSCGALNLPESTTCRVCFAPLQELDLATIEEEEETEPEEEASEEEVEEVPEEISEENENVQDGIVSCPVCGSQNYHFTDEGLAVCDDCGNVFTVTEKDITCPVCGESDFDVSENGLARCNVCGNVFFVDILTTEAPEEEPEEEIEEPKPLKVRYPPKKFDWSTYAVIGLVFALILSSAIPFLVPIPKAPSEIITPDGQFGDWQNITSYHDSLTDEPNRNINIEQTKVASDFKNIYFYMQVQGTQFGDQRGDVTRIFIDTDNNPDTGYALMNLGAEYLIKVDGHGGSVTGTSVYHFNGTNPHDWAGFESAGVICTPYASGSQIELRMSLESLRLNETPKVSVMFFTSDTAGNQDHSDYAVSNVGGSMYIESSIAYTNQAIASTQPVLDLALNTLSFPSTLSSLHFTSTGTADLSQFNLTVLYDDQPIGTGVVDGDGMTVHIDPPLSVDANSTVHLSVMLNAPESQRGQTIGLRLASASVSPGIAYPELSDVMNYYVLEPPTGMVVDGGFADWYSVPKVSEPAGDVQNKDGTPATTQEALRMDLTSYSAVDQGGSAFLYAGVTADIFYGTPVPEIDTPYTPPATRNLTKDRTHSNSDFNSNSGSSPTTASSGFNFRAPEDAALQRVPKQEITGESSMLFFIDSDNNTATGYLIGGIGADYMIRLSGMYGEISTRTLMHFTGSDQNLWSWADLGAVSAASSMNRTEVGVSLADLGMTSSDVADVYVQYVNWNGMGDTSDSSIEMAQNSGNVRGGAGQPPDGFLTGYVFAADGLTPVTGATVVAKNLRTGQIFTNTTWNNTLAGADSNYRIDLYGDKGDNIHLFATDGVHYGEANTTLSDFPKANVTMNRTFSGDNPTAAVNFSVINLGESGKAVNLTWESSSTAYAYRIYRTSYFTREGQQADYTTYLGETTDHYYNDTSADGINGTTYRYLISATEWPGKEIAYSMEKQVTADYTPPTIEHSNMTNVSSTLVRVDAQVSDNVYVDSVTLHYRNWNESSYHDIPMNLTAGDRTNGSWRGYIKLDPAGGNYTISYYITAKDGTPDGLLGTNTGTYASQSDPVIMNATALNDPYTVYGYIYRLNGTVVSGADVWVNYTAGGVNYTYHDTSDSEGRYQVDLTYYEGGEDVLVEAAYSGDHGANSTVIIPANGGSMCNVTLEAPHITLDKTVDHPVANPMDTLTYTIEYDNHGGIAGDVWINDTLPDGVTFMDSSVTPENSSGLTYYWHFSNVHRGNYSFTISVRVNDTTPDNTNLTNNVTCDYASVDGVPLPQVTDNATTLVQRPVISVEKVGPANAVVGDVYSYTIYFNNTGSTAASSVLITDTIPDGLTYISSSDEASRVGDYIWHYSNLKPGSHNITITVRVNGTVSDGTVLTNSVVLNYSVPKFTWTVSDTANTLIHSPQLIVVKTVSLPTAGHNDYLTYRIYFNNTGSINATHVWINDTFPADVSFVNDNASVSHTGTWPSFTWYFTDVTPGVHWFVVDVQVMPSATDGEVLRNNVSIDYDVANGESWSNNDSAVTVVSIPIVSFSKTVDVSTALQGDILTYHLYYNNTGSDSCSVDITDILPVGVTYLDSSASLSGQSGQTLYFNLTAAGSSTNYITIRAIVDDSVSDGTWLNNTAFMNYTADLSGTPYSGGNDMASTQVLSPFIQVSKLVDHLTTGQGQYLNYTIYYNNTGSANASMVWINDTLPNYVTYANDTSGQTPSVSGRTYQYAFGDVAPGPHSFIITVRVNETALDNSTLLNTVTLNYTAENGHEYPGSSDTAATLVTIPDIVVEKTVNNAIAEPGDTLVYTIYFNNTGTNTAQDVWINDTLPTGVLYQADDSGIEHNVTGNTYSWHFTNVAQGNHSFNINVSVDLDASDGQLLINRVTSDVIDQWGHSYPRTSDTAQTLIVRPIISVTKDVSLTDAYPGDVLMYIISYDNTGHSPANVNITDILPAGLTFRNSSIAPTGQSGLTYFWNVTAAAQSTNTLFINGMVDMSVQNGAVLTNNVSLTYTSQNGVVWKGSNDSASTTIHRPLISVDKRVDRTVVSPGDLLVYTITFVNTGDTARNVMVADTLPDNVTYQSDDSGVNNKTSGSTLFWNFSSVSSGSYLFNITVQVNSGTPSGTVLNNSVLISYTAGNGLKAGNDSDYAESIVSAIVVSKIVDKTYVSAGEYLNYTIYFNNTADVVANHVWINDTLPDGVTFVSSTYNSTAVTPDSIGQLYRWHFTNVSASSLNILVVTVQVDSDVSPGQELRNTVFLNYTDDSDNLMQETHSEAVSWVRAPAITVSKTVNMATSEPGDTLTYTIYYNNTGSDTAADVWINDTLPAGVTYLSNTSGHGHNVSGSTYSWHFTNVSNDSHSFQITVKIDQNLSDGTILNNTVTCDYTSAGGVLMPSSSDYAVTTVGRPLITVQKTVSSSLAEPGDIIAYTITYDNTGSTAAGDVWINDILPAEVSYQSDNSGHTPSVSGSTYSWHFTDVAPGTHSFQIYVLVISTVDNLTVTNTVLSNYTGSTHQPLVDSESSDTASFTIVRPVISVEKVVNSDTAYPGDVLTYTIYYNNTGNYSAADVWINDTLPDSTVVSQHFTNVSVGSHSITLNYTVPATAYDGENLTNVVTCEYSSHAGNPYGRSEAQASTYVIAPVIEVVKQVDLSVATIGDVLNYTIYFNNTGSGTAGTVWINDTLPAGLDPISGNYSDAGGTMVTGGHWVFHNVSFGLHSFYFTVRVNSSVADNTTLVNRVSLDYLVNSGLNGQRTTDTASTLIYRPMITVQKTVDITAASPGDYLNYTIYYNNTGHAPAGNVWINDTLPSYVTFVTSSDESHRIADYVWHLTDVPRGPHALNVTVHILADTPSTYLTNWAFLNYTTTAGALLEQSSDSATTAVNAPYIEVSKTVDLSIVYPNGTLVYTISYDNTGSGNAGDVWINDTLPEGVTYQSDSSGHGHNISGSTYSWHFVNVSAGPHSFIVTVSVGDLADGTTLVNTVSCKYTAVNGLVMVPSSDSATTTVVRPIISVQKSVNLATAYPGDTLVYTITFDNTGHGTASDVWINDTLPSQVVYQSSTIAYESHTGNLYVWHLTDVAPGPHSFTINVLVLSTTPDNTDLTNRVEANYTTPFSTYYGGHDNATTHIIRPVFNLVKVVDHAVASPGMFLNYTIYYNNTGHGVADNVWINDTLPSDVVFINSSAESVRNGTTWHFVNLTTGNYILTVTVQVNTTASSGDITNYAYLNYEYGSLSDSATTEITSLATVKTVSLSHASPGDMLTYTIWYNNTASDNAGNVWINDTLPADVTFVNATAGYIQTGLTYSWHFSNVAHGSHHLTINVTINAAALPGTILKNYVHLNYTMNGVAMPSSEDWAVTLVDRPIITVEKIVNLSEATLGSTLRYTIYYNNTGTARANHVWINDTLPDGVRYLSNDSGIDHNVTGNTYSWHFTNVAPGNHSFNITAIVNGTALVDGSYLINHVFLNYTDQQNNSLEESNASASTHFIRPVITVQKSVDRATAAPGDTIVYTIYYSNDGHGVAGDVLINDTLPAGVTYQSDSSGVAHTVSGSTYSWQFTSVAPGPHSFTITVTLNAGVSSGAVLLNTVDLNYTTSAGFPLTPSSDSASTTALVTTVALNKIADRTTAYPRNIITYTIFFNVSGAPANDIWINDTLPSGVSYYSGPTGIEHTSSGQFHSWHLTDVAVGDHNITVQVMVSVDATDGTVLTNSVLLNYTNWEGTHRPELGPATFNVTVLRPVISISKTVDSNTAYLGDILTYTITVSNTGSPASDVWVNDTLPAGVSYQSDTSGSAPSVSGRTYSWHFTSVSATMTFTITVRVVTTSNGDVLRNSVSCEYAAGGYSYADVPNATADTTVIRPIITISKSVDKSTASPGDTLTYTITYNNLGDGTADRVWINDTLPWGTEWVSDTSGVSPLFWGNIYNWTITNVGPGPHLFRVTVKVNSSVSDGALLNNTVSASYRQSNGMIYLSNSAYATTLIRRANFTFSLTESPSPLYPGDSGRYTVTFNSTASSYSDVTITLVMPDGLIYTGDSSGRRPLRDGNNLTWTFFDVAPGTDESFYVNFDVQNYVPDDTTLTATAYFDYKGTNGYQYPQLTDNAPLLVIRPIMDVSIIADRTEARPGDNIVYTIYYNNTGHGDASTAVIALNITGPYTYLSDTSPVSYSKVSGEYIFALSSVGPGTHSFTVTVNADSTRARNGDSISAASALNYEITNGLSFNPSRDSVVTDIVSPVMALEKTVSPGRSSPGGIVVFTITYSNTGSVNATDVWINDILPDGMTFITSSDKANRTGMSWHFTDVAPGTYSFTVTARIGADVPDGAHLVNTATLEYSGLNETLSQSATVVSFRPMIQVVKIADLYNVTAGSYVNYTIYYNNTGSGTAADVWINDTLPDGMTFITSTDEANRTGMSWHFTDVGFGSHWLNITVRANDNASAGTLVNSVVSDYTAESGLWLGRSTNSVAIMISAPPLPLIDNGPVIYHTPIERQQALVDINITAIVTDDFGVSHVYLFYTSLENSTFNRINMTLVSGDALNGTYTATIPGQVWKGIVSYYIWADDTAGNVTIHGIHDIVIYLPSYTVRGHVYQANGDPVEGGYVLVTDNATGDSLIYILDPKGSYEVNLAEMDGGYVNGDHLSVYGTDGSYYNTVYGTVDVMVNPLTLDLHLIYIPEFSSMLVLAGVFLIVAFLHRRRRHN